MRIDLNIPAGEKQQQFVDQLNAAFRALSGGSSGSQGYDANGNFRSIIAGVARLPSGEASLSWSLIWRPDGVLTAVEIEPPEDAEPPFQWAQEVSAVVTSSLAAAFAARQGRFFHRVGFHYIGQALDGEYWFEGLRFAPLLPEDEQPALLNAERVVVFDMNVNAVDATHAVTVANERALRYAARISLLANLGLYNPPHENRWVVRPSQSKGFENMRLQLGFFASPLSIAAMPAKGEICRPGEYSGSLDRHHKAGGARGFVSLPHETRRILRGVDKATRDVVDGFDRCARLYQAALVCGRQYPSVGFAYRVAAIEAIVETVRGLTSFSEFVRANVRPRSDLDAVLEYLYSRVRSAHFHAGEFPSGEFSRQSHFDPFANAEQINRFDLQWRGNEIIREAIVTWILKVISLDTKQEGE